MTYKENRPSVAKRFAGLERVRDALLRLAFTAKGDERFALEIQNVLFADELRRRERAAGQNVGELASDVDVVFGDKPAAEHHVDGELCAGEKSFTENANLRRGCSFG